ncbi:unnamed protein product, partial [Heterotrigona itama]
TCLTLYLLKIFLLRSLDHSSPIEKRSMSRSLLESIFVEIRRRLRGRTMMEIEIGRDLEIKRR